MPDSSDFLKSSRGRKLVVWAWAVAAFIVLIIVVLFAFQPDERPHNSVKESVLRIDLQTMREAIDKYKLEKQKPPQSLQDLVDAKYLRAIPVDPMTYQRDWVVDFVDVPVSSSSVVQGIKDVHSKSTKTSALERTPYNTW